MLCMKCLNVYIIEDNLIFSDSNYIKHITNKNVFVCLTHIAVIESWLLYTLNFILIGQGQRSRYKRLMLNMIYGINRYKCKQKNASKTANTFLYTKKISRCQDKIFIFTFTYLVMFYFVCSWFFKLVLCRIGRSNGFCLFDKVVLYCSSYFGYVVALCYFLLVMRSS